MKKLLLMLALLVAAPAYATCTWTMVSGNAQGACTATEAAAPTQATDGLSLTSGFFAVKGVAVVVEAAGTMTATSLLCWIYNPASASWSRMPDWDLTVQALQKQAFFGITLPFNVAGMRVAWQPAAAGQTNTVYIIPG